MTTTLRTLGLIGLAFFLFLFALVQGFVEPFEHSARRFISQQISSELQNRYHSSQLGSLTDKARTLAGKLKLEKHSVNKHLNQKLHEKIAEVIGSLCGYNCEKKQALAQSIGNGYRERIAQITQAEHNLSAVIHNKYMEIATRLQWDVSIFLLSNATMFLMLLLISFLKPAFTRQLFLPATLLLIATLAASFIYLFGQNWFYTLFYDDYMGFGYLAYIGIIFGLLLDIALNKARVTTEIINNILHALASITPC